ncbi:hypothetical protein [Deinococcus pimensis]|uniref:hypothetical protein n=1 Tax=Deinococcus pimensis TaxID=309888 RepID=UPI0005EBE367|nr:hypothetical protein [Deinococcus pimensis]
MSTSESVNLMRHSHGRNHFQLRWGSEEKHADTWENVVLFSRQRTPEWIAEHTERLRSLAWSRPFPNAITNLVYPVLASS